MASYPGVRLLMRGGADLATTQSYADKSARKAQRVRQAQEQAAGALATLENLNVPTDDGTPPGAARNVVVNPWMHALDVSWDDPAPTDNVERSLLTVTPQNGVPRVFRGGPGNASAVDLAPVPHTVDVVLVDIWGRQSAVAGPFTATPDLTAAEQVNLAELAQQGRLTGLLPNVNLAPIGDPSKFAESVVNNTALAAGQNANVLPWAESSFENYADGEAWPPVGVASVLAAGATAQIVTYRRYKWLRISTGASGTGNQFVYSNYATRGTVDGQTYIYSLYVRNTGAVPKSVGIQVFNASDSQGAGSAIQVSSVLSTIPADGREYRVFVKFTQDSTRPYYRFAVRTPDGFTQVDVNRFQLEAVSPNKTEPGPYSVPVTTFGVMSGLFLATMDAAIVNAVIGDLAVGTQKVKDLTADKLRAGTMTAGAITLAGNGSLHGGRTVLDSSGITLGTTDQFDRPAQDPDYKIVNGGQFASYSFYQLPANGHRGVYVRAEGNSSNVRGQIVFDAFLDGSPETEQAALNIRSGYPNETARVWMYPRAEVLGDLILSDAGNLDLRSGGRLLPYWEITGNINANTGTNWNVPSQPRMAAITQVFYRDGSVPAGFWRPVPTASGDIWWEQNVTGVTVNNGRNNAISVKIQVYL